MIGFFGGFFIEIDCPGFSLMRLVEIFYILNVARFISYRRFGKTQYFSPYGSVLGLDFPQGFEQ